MIAGNNSTSDNLSPGSAIPGDETLATKSAFLTPQSEHKVKF
jgi:hypothetical protein